MRRSSLPELATLLPILLLLLLPVAVHAAWPPAFLEGQGQAPADGRNPAPQYGHTAVCPFASVRPITETVPLCFWSDEGLACETRVAVSPTATLQALLAGPTPDEQARGLVSAIPPGTVLAGFRITSDGTTIVSLDIPPEGLRAMSPEAIEAAYWQIAQTLEPLGWRDLRVQVRDPATGDFVPLASFLPDLPAPRKETVAGEGDGRMALQYVGQPPAPGQPQPQGALKGKTIYVSAGHGWLWTGYGWKTQRPPYPTSPYVGPIIEDHNNAEAVNQYLLQYLRNAGATVIPVREQDMNADAVVVDNDAPSPGTYAESGTWVTSGLTGYQGTTYRYALTITGTATATATWIIPIPADGHYALYAWYRQGVNRAPDAHYTVHHAGGRTEVIVDQRAHGNTWHYLGTYGFRGGEVATVTLSNLSAYAGRAVIADAIRLGGGRFSSLTEVYTTTASYPPNKPWWEVGAFYHVQRMGLDPSGWPSYGYFNDVVARPMYARWEHAGTGEDAVYISWHSNGTSSTGYQTYARGTATYAHNGEGQPRTEGSLELRHAVHTEILRVLRAAWDPAWPDAGEKEANLGELRELWDDDPAVRMPGALVEIAYHDNPTDADALKEPNFNRLVARAIYQGIVKYFETRDGIDLPVLPEPPTHLVVRNIGGGQVRISWRPPLVDSSGLFGDPPTGYRVYTSTDGTGWSDGVAVTGTTIYTITGLSPGQLLFVRVTATNDGGESFPTETLAVRVGDSAPVLVVNGFDRLNRTMLIPETDPYNLRMLLGQMNSYDYIIQHAMAISYPLDSAANEAVRDGDVLLSGYKIVDWILGEESAIDETLDATERTLLRGFLENGGALFISGAEIGWHLDYLGADPAFYNDVLRADYIADDAGTYVVTPTTGSIFAGLPPFRFDAPGMYDPDFPDVITPVNEAQAALAYVGGMGGTAAVQYAQGCGRLVYFGFPFETIDPLYRSAVMERVVAFLTDDPPSIPAVTLITPTDGVVLPAIPAAILRWQPFPEGDIISSTLNVDGRVFTVTETVYTYTFPSEGLHTWGVQVTDRAGNVSSWVTTTFIVQREEVFLPLVVREWGAAFPSGLANGGFETDEGWTLNSLAVYTTTVVRSGARSVHLGIPPGDPGRFIYSSVSQTFVVPAGTVTLTIWVYGNSEGDRDDLFYISLYDGGGQYHLLDTWPGDLPKGQWLPRQYDLSPYAGQQVTLYIGVKNDGDDLTAAMYVDDVSCTP